jgi:hypothetical protein
MLFALSKGKNILEGAFSDRGCSRTATSLLGTVHEKTNFSTDRILASYGTGSNT